jgi:hypothetical protein
MRKQLVSSVVMIGFLLLAGNSLTAAAASGSQISAKIPFSFVVKDKVLPAGEYTITKIHVDSAPALVFRSADGKGQMVVQMLTSEASRPSPDTRLVFHRYGDDYYLSDVWMIGTSTGLRLATSAGEERLTKVTAQVDRSTITVAGIAR